MIMVFILAIEMTFLMVALKMVIILLMVLIIMRNMTKNINRAMYVIRESAKIMTMTIMTKLVMMMMPIAGMVTIINMMTMFLMADDQKDCDYEDDDDEDH